MAYFFCFSAFTECNTSALPSSGAGESEALEHVSESRSSDMPSRSSREVSVVSTAAHGSSPSGAAPPSASLSRTRMAAYNTADAHATSPVTLC